MAANNARLSNLGTWIGEGPGTYNVATLDFPGALGSFYEDDGKMYQLVKFHASTTTIANGTPVMWQDYDDYVVTAKVSDSDRNHIAGVALGTQTAAYFGFIQVAGPHSAVITEGNPRLTGQHVFMNSTDGCINGIAIGTAPTHETLGVTTSANTLSAVPVQIRVRLNW